MKINNKTKTGSFDVPDQIKFKTAKIKSSLCDYIDAQILAKGTVTITGDGGDMMMQQN